jgi:Rab GDP dissociation inhibitor
MLETPFDSFVYDDQSQRVVGVRSGDKTFKAPRVICDPSYAADRVCLTHRVIRAICLLDHPIPSAAESCQIILPQKQLHRHHDIYVSCLSSSHNVCPPGFYLAQISTIVETANPEAEIAPAIALLGGILEKFVSISNLYEPLTDGSEDGVFISRSMDSSTHFESVCADVKNIFSRIFGRSLAVQQRLSAEEEQSQRDPSRTSTAPEMTTTTNNGIQEV